MATDCPQCGESAVETRDSEYGTKEVCSECGHVVRDVDAYAGVMVWAHKTAPEIEIHASKASADQVNKATRHSVPQGGVRVVREVGVMATRRGTTAPSKSDASRFRGSGPSRPEPKQRINHGDKLRPHVGRALPALRFGQPRGALTATQFSIAVLRDIEPHLAAWSGRDIDTFITSLLGKLGWRAKHELRLRLALALRAQCSPRAGGKTIRVVKLGSTYFTPDRPPMIAAR